MFHLRWGLTQATCKTNIDFREVAVSFKNIILNNNFKSGTYNFVCRAEWWVYTEPRLSSSHTCSRDLCLEQWPHVTKWVCIRRCSCVPYTRMFKQVFLRMYARSCVRASKYQGVLCSCGNVCVYKWKLCLCGRTCVCMRVCVCVHVCESACFVCVRA